MNTESPTPIHHGGESEEIMNKDKKLSVRRSGSGIRHQATGDRRQVSGDRRQATGIRLQALGVRRQVSGVVRYALCVVPKFQASSVSFPE